MSGKRLPHEWEWQYAAQSNDGRPYPWGVEWRSDLLPPPDHGPKMQPLSDVDAFSKGASVFGVLDLTGNVSQWTDEYRDPYTRAAIVRGGAAYRPTGSIWYFPQTTAWMSTKNICSSHRAAIEQAQSDFDVWLMHWELIELAQNRHFTSNSDRGSWEELVKSPVCSNHPR